jgi:hypothetical protein
MLKQIRNLDKIFIRVILYIQIINKISKKDAETESQIINLMEDSVNNVESLF